MRIEDKLNIRYACKNLNVEVRDIDEKEGIVPLDNNAHLSKSDDTKTVDFSIPIK